ncbi:PREDICTED: TP53-regulating kinase-like [Priapulus caudatus]|uniref:non-specific serine/threonine protein kinase n=1 Tax=Priapulus caudatus TaxID=37621 RepID=A0ABM1EUP2_PRICU|nr:PREDICTED: TP53-regulating kinase-like [Priapulus caudatus]
MSSTLGASESSILLKQGAESKIHAVTFLGLPTVVKERFPKTYRHPALDASLTRERMKAELRAIAKCRQIGVRVPVIYFVDEQKSSIYMEHIQNSNTVRDFIQKVQAGSGDAQRLLVPLMAKVGAIIGTLHSNNLIHGDLTTSNMLLLEPAADANIILIDFGLSYVEASAEDKGVDLYVLERAFLSTHPNSEELFAHIISAYQEANKKGLREVMSKFEEVRLRGRKRSMVG